jgi:PAS domain S-box-containing protein
LSTSILRKDPPGMTDESRTKEQLIKELHELQRKMEERSGSLHEMQDSIPIAERRAEEALQESEARYRIIVENSNDAIYVHDFGGNIIDVNDNACRLVGYDRAELIGSNLSLIDSQWRQNSGTHQTEASGSAHEDLERLLRDGAAVFERRNIRRDGTVLPVEVSVKIASREGKGLVLGFVRDITARKKLEADFQKHQRFLTDLVEYSGTVIFVKDVSGRYVLVNRKWEEVTGFEREDTIGKRDGELFPGPAGEQFRLNDVEAMDSKAVLEKEEVFEAAGSKRFFLSVKFPLFDEKGGVTGVCGMAAEITGRKKAEAELSEHRNRLEEMVKERTEALESKTQILEEINMALKVLLRQRDEDRAELEGRFVENIRRLVLPYVEKMKKTAMDGRQASYMDILETHLDDIVTPLLKHLQQFHLTSTEMQVASLLKQRRTTKEISRVMGIAVSSVDTHRKNIRKKLGLSRQQNLQSHLRSLK